MGTIFALVLASGFCVCLVEARQWRTHTPYYDFLIWNLILAWIPFLLALRFYEGYRRGSSRSGLAVVAAFWLLFLPNAPYMVTDLVHLGRIPGAPLWFDGGMIAAFAGTGLVLGLGSVYLVHAVARRALGVWRSWLLLAPVLGLCSLGVMLGRVERLNSWDAVVRPRRLLDLLASHIGDPSAQVRMAALAGAYTAFLAVAYLVFYSFSGLRLDDEREEP